MSQAAFTKMGRQVGLPSAKSCLQTVSMGTVPMRQKAPGTLGLSEGHGAGNPRDFFSVRLPSLLKFQPLKLKGWAEEKGGIVTALVKVLACCINGRANAQVNCS